MSRRGDWTVVLARLKSRLQHLHVQRPRFGADDLGPCGGGAEGKRAKGRGLDCRIG